MFIMAAVVVFLKIAIGKGVQCVRYSSRRWDIIRKVRTKCTQSIFWNTLKALQTASSIFVRYCYIVYPSSPPSRPVQYVVCVKLLLRWYLDIYAPNECSKEGKRENRVQSSVRDCLQWRGVSFHSFISFVYKYIIIMCMWERSWWMKREKKICTWRKEEKKHWIFPNKQSLLRTIKLSHKR